MNTGPITYNASGWPTRHRYRTLTVPTHRPNGHAYTATELHALSNWAAQCIGMSRRAYEEQERDSSTARKLKGQGWTQIMPGQWVRGLHGPARTRDAELYSRQIYRLTEIAERRNERR